MSRAATTAPADTTPSPIEPHLYEPPTVEIAGEPYRLRRLGVQDVFTVSKILGRGAALFSPGREISPTEILQVLLLALTQTEGPVLQLMASLIGVTREDLDDPARFPMSTPLLIAEALAAHQDLADFLAALGRLAERMPEIQTRSGASSTS